MKDRAPGARIIGLDPDPDVLHRAEAKARKADVEIEWRQGFASDAATLGVRIDKTVSSLVFHQVPLAGKRSAVADMFAALNPGLELHIAAYAAHTSPLLLSMFRLTVQHLDSMHDHPNRVGGGRYA